MVTSISSAVISDLNDTAATCGTRCLLVVVEFSVVVVAGADVFVVCDVFAVAVVNGDEFELALLLVI